MFERNSIVFLIQKKCSFRCLKMLHSLHGKKFRFESMSIELFLLKFFHFKEILINILKPPILLIELSAKLVRENY